MKDPFTHWSNSKPERKSKAAILGFFPFENGLLTFSNDGELHGPLLALQEDGKPHLFSSYALNQRDGTIRYWDQDGETSVSLEFKAGRKLGITCVYLDSRPQLVEEWGTSQIPDRYWVVTDENSLEQFTTQNVDKAPLQMLRHTEALLAAAEQELEEQEMASRRRFRSWWNKNDAEFKRMNRSLASSKDNATRNHWKGKIEEKTKAMRSESDRALAAFLSRL